MKRPTWKVSATPPWGCAYGEYARFKGFRLTIALWNTGLKHLKAIVEYRGGPGGGWVTADFTAWPDTARTNAEADSLLNTAREWCENVACTHPKAKAEG